MNIVKSILITVVFVSGTLQAETGFRKYAGEFMSIDVSARAQALGGAFSAVSNDAYAAFYNPAGLAQIQSTQIAFTHTQQFLSSVNYDFVGFSRPISPGKTIGFSLIRLGIDNIQDSQNAGILDDNGVLMGIDESQLNKFNSADYVFFFSLGQEFSEKLMLGFSAKLVRRNLADHTANGLGFDAGALYRFSERWHFSAMFRNLTSTLIAWDTGEKELVVPNARIGSSYLIDIPGLKSQFRPNMDVILNAENTPNIAVDGPGSGLFAGAIGGELIVNQRLFLRGGFDDFQRVNFGIGVKIPHLNFDYAFTRFDQELGNAHRIGILVDFSR